MTKSASEIFNDKVSLIYEYNDKSPLFVRVANTEIENNNLETAIEILTKGTKLYPQYSTAFLLLGRANILIGNYSAALKFIKKGSDLIHSKKTYEHYFKELENVKKQRSLFQDSARGTFMPDYNTASLNKEAESYTDEKKTSDDPEKPIEERLDQIAKEISGAKIPEMSESPEMNNLLGEDSQSSMIVSETLAKIYTAQGELKEAIEVYKKLIKKEPGKEKYFSEKIGELKKRLES